MKKTLMTLVLSAVVAGGAYAAGNMTEKSGARKVKCDVESLKDAEACMEKVAASMTEYEEPNEGRASAQVSELVYVLNALGAGAKTVSQAEKADFAGMVFEHNDEHHIYYFAIKKGANVTPAEVYDLNTVDFEYELKKPYEPKALKTETYFLGLDCKDSDTYSEAEDRLAGLR